MMLNNLEYKRRNCYGTSGRFFLKIKRAFLGVAIFAICTLVLSLFSVQSLADEAANDGPMTDEYYEEIMRKEEPASNAYEALMEFFDGKYNGYPEYYGGAFIKDFLLHIAYLPGEEGAREEMEVVVKQWMESVVWDDAAHSYNKMLRIGNEISAIFTAENLPFSGWYYSCSDGKLRFRIRETDRQKACAALNEDYLAIIEFENYLQLQAETDVYGGLAARRSIRGFTIAICGRYQGQDAFLTGGHQLSAGQNVSGIGANVVLGTLSYVQICRA